MKTSFTKLKLALTAVLTLAIALTLSCSSDDGGDGISSSSGGGGSLGGNSSSSSEGLSVASSSSESDNGGGNDGISSSSGMQISSSSQQEQSVSSSSSGQGGAICASLNNHTMAVEMNLNGEPVVVRKNGSVLTSGVNYEVIEDQNSVKVQGLLDYIGSVERGSSPVNVPEIVVRDGEKILAEGTDYEVVNTGNFIKFVGINDYAGSVEVELPCVPEPPEPSGLGYFGNVGTLGVIDFMADPNHAVWSSTSYNMDLPNYNTASGVGFRSFEVAKPGNTPITFTKAGYRFIALPAELGYPSRINDVLGLDAKGVAFTVPPSNKIIKGQNYIVYEGVVSAVDGNLTATIIYEAD